MNKRKKVKDDEINLENYDLKNGQKFDFDQLQVDSGKKEILHMRIDPKLVEWLKKSALKEGMAYQTYIHYMLSQLMTGKLAETSPDLIKRIERIEKKLKIA